MKQQLRLLPLEHRDNNCVYGFIVCVSVVGERCMSLRKRGKNHKKLCFTALSVVQYHLTEMLLSKKREMLSNISRSGKTVDILHHPLTDAYRRAYPRSTQGQEGFQCKAIHSTKLFQDLFNMAFVSC